MYANWTELPQARSEIVHQTMSPIHQLYNIWTALTRAHSFEHKPHSGKLCIMCGQSISLGCPTHATIRVICIVIGGTHSLAASVPAVWDIVFDARCCSDMCSTNLFPMNWHWSVDTEHVACTLHMFIMYAAMRYSNEVAKLVTDTNHMSDLCTRYNIVYNLCIGKEVNIKRNPRMHSRVLQKLITARTDSRHILPPMTYHQSLYQFWPLLVYPYYH